MPIKSFKEKISQIASGEVLGEAEEEMERKRKESSSEGEKPQRRNKPRKKKNKKTGFFNRKKKPQPKPKKEVKEDYEDDFEDDFEEDFANFKDNFYDENAEDFQDDNTQLSADKDAIEGYQDVIRFLGIKEDLDLDVDFTAKDLDYIEFGQTTPIGLDYDEVTDFIARAKYTMSKLEGAIKQRNKDVVTLASEVKKVESKMAERAQEAELERMMGSASKEEMLAEENMELVVRVNELEQRIIELGSPEEVSQLRKEVEVLRAENNMLRSTSQRAYETKNSESKSSMPPLNVMPSLNPAEAKMPTLEPSMPSLSKLQEDPEMPSLDPQMPKLEPSMQSMEVQMPSLNEKDEFNNAPNVLKMPKLD